MSKRWLDPERMTTAERLMYADRLALEMFREIPPKPAALPPGIVRLSDGLLRFDLATS